MSVKIEVKQMVDCPLDEDGCWLSYDACKTCEYHDNGNCNALEDEEE